MRLSGGIKLVHKLLSGYRYATTTFLSGLLYGLLVVYDKTL